MEAAAKREKEKQVIQEMISLYCRKQHHGQSLCKECQTLCRYAHQRIDCCPFCCPFYQKESKTRVLWRQLEPSRSLSYVMSQ